MKTDNELIAKFMGAEVEEATPGIFKRNQRHFNFSIIHGRCPAGLFVILPEELKYHESWDWLMPVVEKIATIERMDFSIKAYIGSGGLQVFDSLVDSQNGLTVSFIQQKGEGSLIEVTYKSVIEFIKWYNEQKFLAS